MSTTVSQLTRAFGIVVRQIADLMTMLQDYHALSPNLAMVLDISYQEAQELQLYLELHLKVRSHSTPSSIVWWHVCRLMSSSCTLNEMYMFIHANSTRTRTTQSFSYT